MSDTASVNETMANTSHDDKDDVTSPEEDVDTTSSESYSPIDIQRSLFITAIFLSIVFLIDATCTIVRDPTSSRTVGPLQSLAEFVIPRFVTRYRTTPLFVNEDIGIDGRVCPPGGFLDRGLIQQTASQKKKAEQQQLSGGITYSQEYDPRNKKSKPSSFPHCELKKWVQLHENNHDSTAQTSNSVSRQCPEGEEYVTHIYPTEQTHRKNSQKTNPKDVKIIHIAAPTNCIPTSTISSLQTLSQHYYHSSKPQITIAIYIHSQETIDAFLYQRVWNVFPEVKEGLLCGMAKVKFVVKKILDEVLKESDEKEKQQQQQQHKEDIANEIATLTKRDIWRFLILWEFGGTVIDLEVLESVISTPDASSTAAADDDNDSPLINVARQWYASQWFGRNDDETNKSTTSSDDGDAIITIIENGKERVPLRGIITSSPQHPLLYFCAKWSLRSMISDNYLVWGESSEFRAFNAMGRNTDLATLQAGLNYVLGKDWGVKSKQIGNANKCDVDKTKSVRFLNGNDVFPKTLALPMQDMMTIIKRHVVDKSELEDDSVIIKSFQDIEAKLEKMHKSDETFVSRPDPIIFSCMEYRLQVYTNNVAQL